MAKKTLVSDSNSSSTAVATMPAATMPAIFQSTADAPQARDGGSLPYVVFVNPKSKKFTEWAAQGIKDGDVILCHGDTAPVKLDPFKFVFAQARQYWIDFDMQGNAADVRKAKPDDKGAKHKEVFETMVIVLHGDSATPATCAFKGPRAPAVHKALKALEVADSEDWFKRSPDHEQTRKIPQPHLRFVTTVSQAKRTAKTTGLPYFEASGTVSPMTPGAADALKRLDAGLTTEVFDRFQSRVKELDAKAK